MGRRGVEAQGGERDCEPESYPNTCPSGTIIGLPFPRSPFLKSCKSNALGRIIEQLSQSLFHELSRHRYNQFFFSKRPKISRKESLFNRPLTASRLVTFHQNLLWIVFQTLYRHLTKPSPNARLKATHIPGTFSSIHFHQPRAFRVFS